MDIDKGTVNQVSEIKTIQVEKITSTPMLIEETHQTVTTIVENNPQKENGNKGLATEKKVENIQLQPDNGKNENININEVAEEIASSEENKKNASEKKQVEEVKEVS